MKNCGRSLRFLGCALLVVFFADICEGLHRAHLAGTWYPQQPKELASLLSSFEKQAQERFALHLDGSKIRALVVPHASLTYSGAIAIASYRLLDKNSIDRVIIIAPSHTMPIAGVALPAFDNYEMPSGPIKLDGTMIDSLSKSLLFQKNDAFFLQEHAIEVQLPFIQSILPNAKIVPMIVGTVSKNDVDSIAKELKSVITSRTLVVVTSDLTHYGTRFNYTPFAEHEELQVRQQDASLLWLLQEQDRNGFTQLLHKSKATWCGTKPIEILLALINLQTFGDVSIRLVAYGTSRDKVLHDDNFVSYGSLVVCNQPSDCCWSQLEKNELLHYARATLRQSFNKNLDQALLKPLMTSLLQKPLGVFVTLYKNDGTKKELRGCIGRVFATKPLYLTVAEMVVAAATHDTRFAPVTADELKQLIIEISVLTEPVPVASYKDIVLNKHGIILTVGNATALFLPKVPREHGFTLDKTLSELSKKAHLDAEAWRSPHAKFEVFEAIDFSE